MTKRSFCGVMAAVMVLLSLSACGKREEIDYFMEGYDAVKEKRYEDALQNFQEAAKQGDGQAETAAKIIDGYFRAREAFQVGDGESAKEFLAALPENYRYYAISEDIEALKRLVYSGQQEEPQPESLAEKTLEEAAAKQAENDRILQQVKEEMEDGHLDRAEKKLTDMVLKSLTGEQLERWQNYRMEIAEKRQENQQPKNEELSPEKAVEYLRAAYPEVQGDVSAALAAQYDEAGQLYYAVTIQLGQGEDMEIKTLHIRKNGIVETVEE